MSMNTNTKYNKRKEELFTQIAEVINKHGYENITVRGICSELNISIGTFYHYFTEKDDLIEALFDDIDNYFLNNVQIKFSDNEMDNLRLFAISYGEYIVKNGIEVCKCINIAPLNNTKMRYLHEKRGIFSVLEGILLRGQDNKEFILPKSANDSAAMILILLRGYCADWSRNDGNYDIVSTLDEFITLFSKCLK